MAGEITLSSAVRNNLLSLQNTAQLLGRTQERLATGLKVNSALDDPTAFFTASALNSRAGDLSRLLDSVGNALQTIRAADNGIEAITALVESAQASARQALQSPGAVTTAAAAATTTGGVLFAANDTAALLTGTATLSADTAATITGTAITTDTAAIGTGTDIGADTQEIDASGLNIGDGVTLTVSDGTNSVTFEVDYDGSGVSGGNIQIGDGNQTIASVITEINNALTAASVDASFTNAGTGSNVQLQFQASNNDVEITLNASNASFLTNLGLGAIGSGPDATDRTLSPTNATVAALDGTLSIQVGTETATTLDLSTTNSIFDLRAALTTLAGGTLALNASDQIVASATANNVDIVLSVSGGSGPAAAFQTLGFGDGSNTSRTVESTNTSTGLAAAIAGNETLVFTNGGNTATIIFGNNDGTDQVSNRTELEARLAALTGSNFTLGVSSNNITAAAPNVAAGAISVTGGTNALLFGGFTGGQQALATNSALAAISGTATIQFGAGSPQNLAFAGIDSVETLDSALAAITGGTAARTSSGAIQITGSNTTDTVTIGGTVTGTGLTATTYNPTAASTTNNADRAALEAEFNNLRTQIDQLAADASFNGNNLLNGGSLSVIFNENGSSSLAINGVTFDSAGLGISVAATDSFQSNTSINASLTELDSAIASLRQQASTFGSNLSVVEIRQDFTKNLVNTLETGAANLTLADANEEGANVLALQTRQQLSSVALSLASQADQNVLRLF